MWHVRQTLDFLLRQAIQAVLTHRRFADADVAEAGESLSPLRDLCLNPLDDEEIDEECVGAYGASAVGV